VFAAFEGTKLLEQIAVVGLGTGTLACYSKPGQTLTFYEIDPAVYRIASEPRYFTYLQDAKARGVTLQVILGDARLQLATAAARQYGMIIIDAFSSDAIPIHLITREALELYVTKLMEGGLVALHISNRHLDLVPVLGNLAQAAHLVGLEQHDDSDEASDRLRSQWVILARRLQDFGRLAAPAEPWKPLTGRPDVGVWTDDFSNLLSVFQWQK
jgi:spermidine synthase